MKSQVAPTPIVGSSDDVATVHGEQVTVPGLSRVLAEVAEQGYSVIHGWLDGERLQRLERDLRRDIDPIRELLPPDRRTVRAHNLLAKTRCVDDLICDPRLLAVVQGVLGKHIQLSIAVMFDLLPGARAQGLHQDDGLWPAPRPHPPFVCNTVIAVEDFTAENGATVVVPGSHKWHDQPVRQPPDVETVQLTMPAGSMAIWNGALWHGGGGNRTANRTRRAVNLNYNLSWLRQQENQYIGVPRSELPKMPLRLQRLLGYQHGVAIAGAGMVDLRDPLDMLDLVSFGYDINDARFPPLGRPRETGGGSTRA